MLERDELSPNTLERPGVPQGRQPHVYLRKALSAAEEPLPGLRDDLEANGGVPFDTGQLAWLGETGWAPVGPSGHSVVSLTRPLFEQVVRTRVLALDGVELRDGHRVNGVQRSQGNTWRVETDGGPVGADLVVDALGRASRMPTWLQAQ